MSRLLARYRAEGDAAFEPRSRDPGLADRDRARTVELIVNLREHSPAGPRRRPRHHRLAPRAPPPDHGVGRDDARRPVAAGLIEPEPKKRPNRPTSASRPSCPTRPGSPTSPTSASPDGTDAEILTWLDDHSRYALSVTAHRRVTGTDRGRHLHPMRSDHGFPASILTDNGWSSPPASPAAEAAATASRPNSSPRHHPEELPPEPPDHLRQGRTVPTDPEEMARRPTRARHHRPNSKTCSTRSSTTTTTTDPTAPSTAPPRGAYHAPQSQPRRTDADTHYRIRHDRVDTTGIVTLRLNGRHPPHRPRPNPRRNPRHPARRTTSTSASSTPPPANSSAHLTLDPTRDYQPRPKTMNKDPNPLRGFGPCRCLATSHWWRGQDSNLRHTV